MRRLLLPFLLSLGFALPAHAESANGTSIPVGTSIVDASGATWTLTLDTTRTVMKNGVSTGLTGVMELWYLNHNVWAYAAENGWQEFRQQWQSTSTGPVVPGPPPLPTTAAPRVPLGPQTGVSCSGVNLTSASNVQAAVDANPTGTTFCLAAGTYNAAAITPKDNDVFIGAYDGTSGAVLDGNNANAFAFWGPANNVTIRNLFIQNYSTGTQDGTLMLSGEWNIIQQNSVRLSGAAGVNVCVAANPPSPCHALVIGNIINDNAEEGYSAHGVGVVFDSNEIGGNNPTGVAWDGGEQGGGKSFATSYLLFMYNYSHDNGGSGFWTDYNNIYTMYWYNKSRANQAGIEHEISYNASIIGNDLQGDGAGPLAQYCPQWYFACGEIMLENSGGIEPGSQYSGMIEVANNIMKPGASGRTMVMRQQNRGNGDFYTSQPYNNWNIWIHNNTMDWTDATVLTDGMVGLVQDTGADLLFYPDRDNLHFDYNTYIYGSTPNQFTWWDSSANDFATWQSYGLDVHGTASATPQ